MSTSQDRTLGAQELAVVARMNARPARRRLTPEEEAALTAHHGTIVDAWTQQEIEGISQRLVEAHVLSGNKDFATRPTVEAFEPMPPAPGREEASADQLLLEGACDGVVTSPPFETGSPIAEFTRGRPEVIADTNPPEQPGQPSSFAHPARPRDLAVESAMAIPARGVLSAGVAVGRLHVLNETLGYPPEREVPQQWNGIGEFSEARATIGHLFAELPGQASADHAQVTVGVSAEIGTTGQPSFLAFAVGGRSYGSASLHLWAVTSSGSSLACSETFLAQGTVDTPIARSAVGLRCSMPFTPPFQPMPPHTPPWVYVSVQLRLAAARLYVGLPAPPPPNYRDRPGFAGIDLRDSQATHAIYYPYRARGPVRVRRLVLRFCA